MGALAVAKRTRACAHTQAGVSTPGDGFPQGEGIDGRHFEFRMECRWHIVDVALRSERKRDYGMQVLVSLPPTGCGDTPCSKLSDVISQISTCARFGTVSGVQHESNLPFELDGNSRLAIRLTVSCALNPSAPGEVVVIILRDRDVRKREYGTQQVT